MLDATTVVPPSVNEPVRSYAPGSPERVPLDARLKELGSETQDLTTTIAGRQAMARGERIEVRAAAPAQRGARCDRGVGRVGVAGRGGAALAAAAAWRETSFDDRAAVVLRAAELLAGPWRDTLNPRRCWGQSKSVLQAEIKSASSASPVSSPSAAAGIRDQRQHDKEMASQDEWFEHNTPRPADSGASAARRQARSPAGAGRAEQKQHVQHHRV